MKNAFKMILTTVCCMIAIANTHGRAAEIPDAQGDMKIKLAGDVQITILAQAEDPPGKEDDKITEKETAPDQTIQQEMENPAPNLPVEQEPPEKENEEAPAQDVPPETAIPEQEIPAAEDGQHTPQEALPETDIPEKESGQPPPAPTEAQPPQDETQSPIPEMEQPKPEDIQNVKPPEAAPLDMLQQEALPVPINEPAEPVSFFMDELGEWELGCDADVMDNNLRTYAWSSMPITESSSFGIQYHPAAHIKGFRVMTGEEDEMDALGGAVLEYRISGEDAFRALPNGDFYGSREWDFSNAPLENVAEMRVRATEETGGYLILREIGEYQPAEQEKNIPCTVFLEDLQLMRSSLELVTDSDPYTLAHFASPGSDTVSQDSAIGLDFGTAVEIGWVKILQGRYDYASDRMLDATLEYSLDGVTYHMLHEGLKQDELALDLQGQGIYARYLRLRNGAQTNGWASLRMFTAGYAAGTIPVETNAAQLAQMRCRMDDAGALFAPNTMIILQPGEYIGLPLPRMYTLAELELETVGAAPDLQVGCSEWECASVLPAQAAGKYARFIRLKNTGDSPCEFVLTKLRVQFAAGEDPALAAAPGIAGHMAACLFDGDEETSYIPENTQGELVYRLSERLDAVKQLYVGQKGAASNAAVEIRPAGQAAFYKAGNLDGEENRFDLSSFDTVAEIRLRWNGALPELTEMELGRETPQPTDKNALNSLLKQAQTLAAAGFSGYETALVHTFEDARDNALTVQNSAYSMWPAVERAVQRLTAAMDALQPSGSGGTEQTGWEKSDAVTGVTVTADAGVIPAEAALKVTLITQAQRYEAAQTATDYLAGRMTLYEIALQNGIQEVTLKDAVSVSIPAPESYEIKRVRLGLLHADGTWEAIAFRQKNSYIQFKAKRLYQGDAFVLWEQKQESTQPIPSGGSGGASIVPPKTPAPAAAPLVEAPQEESAADWRTDGVTIPPDGEVTLQIVFPTTGDITHIAIPVHNLTERTAAYLVRTDGSEILLRKTAVKGGNLVVPLNGPATLRLRDNSRRFHDVQVQSAFASAIDFVSSRELFIGVGKDRFAPDAPMTRAMLTAVLHRLENQPSAGLPAFKDVAADSYYAEAAAWAAVEGVVQDLESVFQPETIITQAELAAMLYRYAGSPQIAQKEKGAPVWAANAIAWAHETGIFVLDETQASVTRGQAAQALQSFLAVSLAK